MEADFGTSSGQATEILEIVAGHEAPRVQLAILALSRGSLEKLREWTALATLDYREVLFAAE